MPWTKSKIISIHDNSNDKSNNEKKVITGTFAKLAYKKICLDNFEQYRKYHYCPFKGCKSKSLQKLSNHFVGVHKIVNAAEREKVLKEAKKMF